MEKRKPTGKVTDKVILGIDPGTVIMGYGILHVQGQQMKLVDMGILRLDKIDDAATKLKLIFERTVELVEEHLPDELAIEAPFFGKNVQSMLKLGRAQGVAIAAALTRNVPIFEYSPKKIKMSITGNGNASKEQVALMLQRLLTIKDLPKKLDATDGLAAAVCHHFQHKGPAAGKKFGSWKSFLTENPERKA